MKEVAAGTTDEPQQNTGALEDFVASVQHLPLYTAMAARLVRSVEREDITASELGRQIGADAVLASHLLRLANSSFYGMSGRIGTVSDAIAVLGLNMVRRIVTSAVLQRPLTPYLHDTPGVREFWRHQLMCAALARHLQVRKRQAGEEVAYMAGLLHDVGRLVMLVRRPHDYAELRDRPYAPDDQPIAERERERFGFDHAQVGAALLKLWGVPERIVQAVRQHADRTTPDEPIAVSVWHANRLAHPLVDQPPGGPDRPWMIEAGLTAEVRQRIVDEVGAFATLNG